MATEEKTINVVGMHCPSCVTAVELSIKDLDGVEDAKADLESNTAKVTFDSDKVSGLAYFKDSVLKYAQRSPTKLSRSATHKVI